jgi:hypothetical protein
MRLWVAPRRADDAAGRLNPPFYFPAGPRMITTHSPAAATLLPDEVVVVVPPLPGLTVTVVPFGPAVVVPLSPPAPIPTELDEECEPAEAVECEPRDAAPAAFSLRVRQGCSLSTMIVVPPLLPLTIETLAPAPDVELTLSATASVADPASTRPESSIIARMVEPPHRRLRRQTADREKASRVLRLPNLRGGLTYTLA